MKQTRKKLPILCILPMLAFGMQSCGKTSTAPTEDMFSSGYSATTSAMHCYASGPDNQTEVLDFATMDSAALCNKPNCTHKNEDCIMQRLNGLAPVFSGNSIYYFVDDRIELMQNESALPDLKMGTTLYRYDLETGNEAKLTHIDGCAAPLRGGLLLHSDTLYFIGNLYSRYYDENGILTAYGNAGGECHLYSVDLSDTEVQDLGMLYDVDELAKYYPLVSNSGEVVMRGFWNHQIYFDVDFVAEATENDIMYCEYVICYDLADGTYHGVPEDYAHIDSAAVRYASEDYLVICREGEASVYKKGADQPVILEDSCFNHGAFLSVFDDTLFCCENIFDLNTKTVRTLDSMQYRSVVARYGDSYIISDIGMQSGFDKIPVTDLLPK